MTTIEERLARDIAAVEGGVVVTESDLWRAREEVDVLIVERRRRTGRRTAAGAVAAAAVLTLAGIVAFETQGDDTRTTPSGPGPSTSERDAAFLTGKTPTPELIEGVWRLDNGLSLMMFRADGTLRIDQHGTLFSQPVTTGTYEIAGDEITLAMDTGPDGCAGQTYVMRASLPETGDLRFVPAEEGDGSCSSVPHWRGDFEQTLPTNSEFLAGLKTSRQEMHAMRPPARASLLHAEWMAQGGGYLLELTRSGTYYVAGDSGDVLDHGRWRLTGSNSKLSLASDEASTTCDPGDRLVLNELGYVEGGTSIISGTVEQNTCGGGWTPDTWLLLPNEDR